MWALHPVLCLLASVTALPEEIYVGGLFEKTNTLGKMVFIKALEMVNENPDVLTDSKLIPLAEEVPEFDSFQVGSTVCELMTKGIAGIVGPTSSETSAHVQSLCDTMEIPHIETRWDGNQRRGSCLVNLYPHPAALTQAYFDIVKAWNWKRFTVIFDDYDALKKIEKLLTLADDKGYLVTVRQLEETDNYREVLRRIKHSGENNIVLECSSEKLYDVLIQAQQVGLMGSDYSYIITSLDLQTIDLEPFKWGGTNITGIRLVDPEDPDVKEVLRVWSSELEKANNEDDLRKKRANGLDDIYDDEDSPLAIPFDEIAESIPDLKLVTEVPTVEAALLHDAILLFATALNGLDKSLEVNTKSISCDSHTSWEHGYSIMNYMKTSRQKGMSGMIKFDHEGFRTDINLDIIELREEGLVKKGVWSFDGGVNISHPEHSGERVDPGEDLRNTTFIVLIALTHPYGMLKEASQQLSGNDRFEGFGIDLIHELSLMSGFNYTFHVQADKSSGNPDKVTGKWNGMIGEVLAGRADLAIADITITREREKDADFTMPFMNLGISILYRKPTKAPPSLFSFLSPFSYEVWAYMMSAYLGVSLLLFVMARISPYEWRNPYPCIEEPEALENQFSLLNSLWFTMGSLMQQGSEIAPISVSTRMVAAIWWFFTLIMVSSYTANLAAFLTIESTVMNFKNVEELAGQSVIKYGAKDGGSTANFFRDSNVTIYQKMGKFMAENPDVMMASNEAGVNRVLSDVNYAFFMESTSIEYEVERKCELTQVGGLLDNKGYGIVMRQNSSYRNVLSTNVVKLQEKGKLTQLKDKWWKEKRGGGACQVSSEGGAASELDLSNVGGVFVVLLGGCIFAVFLAIFEVLWEIYTRDDKTSFKEELMEEIRFIIQCHGTTKPVKKAKSPSPVDDEENENEGNEEDRESSTYRRFRGNHLNSIFRDENKASLD